MTDIRDLFERHSKSQKSLKDLSWAEKVRLVARLRLEIIALRRRDATASSEKKPAQ